MPPGQGCQVITSDMCFNEGFGEFVEENGLATRSSAYHVVSIIGGQSSGKSTILNHLFGTSFDMMNSKAGRQQTTKGIWCACAQGGEMLVLDVEGTDGREKEDQKEFEGKSALFSLALTDVMMVNMWMHEVGRFNAANLPLIRTVLEVHLKLLDHSGGAAPQASKPLLLFLLRDCDGETPVEQLQADVVRDIEKLWCDAHKPDGMSAAQLTDFFDLECIALPHFVYCKEQWKQDVAALSKRFLDASAEDYVFRGHSGKEVPAESFADYASQLWTDIEKDNDLDLPSQRKMLSIVRCERKRAQHLASFQHQCEADSWPDTATASNFKGEVQARLSALLDAYDQETKGYDADERDKAKALLATAFWERALDKFEALVRVERQAVEEEAAIALPNLLPQSGRLPERGFARKVEAECRRIRRQLLDKVDRFLPAGSPWRDSLNEPEGAATLLDKQLEREVADVNKEFGNIVIAFHQKSLKKSLDKELIRIIDTASPKMWVQIRQAHRAAIESQLDEMKEILEEVGRGADAIKEHRTLRKFADELVADRVANEAVKDNFERKMFAAFDALYNRHKNRSWRMWDSPEQEFETARKRSEEVLEAFCVDQLYAMDDSECPPDDYTPTTWIADARKDELRERFSALIQPELSWAVENRKDNSTHNSFLLVALIIFLGHDELYWLLTNPVYLLGFLLLTGAGGAYYFQQKMGNLAQILELVGLRMPAAGGEQRGGGGSEGVSLKQFQGQGSGAAAAAAGRRVQSYPGPAKRSSS